MMENQRLIIQVYPEDDPDVKYVKSFRPYKKNWTVDDLAQFLGKSKKTIRNMLFVGEIKGFLVGREWRIPYMNVVYYLKQNTEE